MALFKKGRTFMKFREPNLKHYINFAEQISFHLNFHGSTCVCEGCCQFRIIKRDLSIRCRTTISRELVLAALSTQELELMLTNLKKKTSRLR